MSISNSHHSLSTAAACVTAGVALGLALPIVLQKIRPASTTGSKPADSTHAVRSGLDGGIRLSRTDLDGFLTAILVAAGCAPTDAALVANVLTYADRRGIPSHGSNRCDTYVNEIAAGLVDAKARPAVVERDGCCAVVDGNNGLGAVTSNLATSTAIELARELGVGLVTVRSSNHYGAAGYWADLALKRGYIAMSFTSTSPIAVPTGGRSRALGTNPFCFFAPAAGGDSFQLDMATTVVPIGKVEVMDRLGKLCPIGWGVDGDGSDCTDASEICTRGGLYPLGGPEETAGYKGYGLGAFVEIMCSVLSGTASVGPDVQSWSVNRNGPLGYGHCFIVIDPARFGGSGFDDRLGRYLDRMRGLDGDVKVAGDPEKEFEGDCDMKGILLHGPVATSLKALAERYSVGVPPELAGLDVSTSRNSLYG